MSALSLSRLHKFYRQIARTRSHRNYVISSVPDPQAQQQLKPIIGDDEYTAEPHYPPILDLSHECRSLRKRQVWYEQMRQLDTVEEKQIGLNMSRYYGFKCLMLDDTNFHYNCLPFFQHATRTVLNEPNAMPATYHMADEQMDSFVQSVKADIEEVIRFEFTAYTPNPNHIYDPDISAADKCRKRSAQLIAHINRVLTNALIADADHLRSADIDVDPRHEAFWLVGGIEPPETVRRMRKPTWQKKYIDEPVNRQVQYVGQPFLTVRHALPLAEFESHALSAGQLGAVPQHRNDPRTIGYGHEYRHGTTIPGFWPGSRTEFGLLSYHSRNWMAFRDRGYGAADNQEALHAQGILVSYAWLFGQAVNQGFTTLNDITYPLTTQTILTDGQHWSFYAYQLNTTVTHCDSFADELAHVNKCWGTSDMKLFDAVDADGTVIGFNDEVLRHLIRFYVNRPKERLATDMRPYLNKEYPRAAGIPFGPRREFVEKRFKNLMENRPRHLLVPEVYNWEKIYKIDNRTRQLDPKRRFFELGKNPFQRRLDDHLSAYIPKHLRKKGPKSRVKFQWMFYPKI